jgi:hypothetical protein
MNPSRLQNSSLGSIARQASDQWDRADLAPVDRAAQAFLVLLELRQVPETIPAALRPAFDELWDSFGPPSPSAARALEPEQLERCEALTRAFADAAWEHDVDD